MPVSEADDGAVPPPLRLLEHRLATACRGDERRLFALLDAARVPGLKAFLDELKHPYVCLHDAGLEDVAAYLVPLRLEGGLLPWFVMNEDAYRSALFLVADAEMGALREHLRRYLTVRDAGGGECYFRFYDSRVLGPFFEASTPAEAFVFFGPVEFLLAPSPDDPAAAVKLRAWRRPEPPANPPSPPGPQQPFQMRPEQQAVFSRELQARQERRCRQYLRAEYPARLANRGDEELTGTIALARRVAEYLEIASDPNVTLIAEALTLSATKDEFAAIAARPVPQRTAKLLELRESLRTREFRI